MSIYTRSGFRRVSGKYKIKSGGRDYAYTVTENTVRAT